MKRLAFLSAVVLAGFAMTSCIKTRTCTCTTTYSDGTTTTSSFSVTGGKSASKASCEAYESSNSSYTEECELN